MARDSIFDMQRWVDDCLELPGSVCAGTEIGTVKAVLLVLLRNRNRETGTAWISVPTMAHKLSRDRKTVRRAVHCARNVGLIAVVGRKRGGKHGKGQYEYAFPGIEQAVQVEARPAKRTHTAEDSQRAEAETDAESLPAGAIGPQGDSLPKDGDDDESWAHNTALHACRFLKVTPGLFTVERHIGAALAAKVSRKAIREALEQQPGQAVWDVTGPLVKARAKFSTVDERLKLRATPEQLEQARRIRAEYEAKRG